MDRTTSIYKIISIADIHFGSLDPKYTYEQLKKQFIESIRKIDFDVLFICGDYFDAKFMSNNPIISYSLLFMDELVGLCIDKDATILIIEGTKSHDNGQLSLFYHYLQDDRIDIRIVEKIQFEIVKGLRVLCIPEKYGIEESIYEEVLYNSGLYDLCVLHGTIKGSVYGAELATLKSTHTPVFTLSHFKNCLGPILCGHVHKSGCFEQYIYYNGCPLRYKFGEEEPKGFLVTLYNSETRMHYTELIPIDSYTYNTINISDLIDKDPKEIIEYIKTVKEKNGIDFIRIQFSGTNDNMNIVKAYFRNSNSVRLQELDKKTKQKNIIDEKIVEQNNKYPFIFNDSLSDYDKFVEYINKNEGYEFISTEDLITLLEECA